ncbi:AAA family ATPase [Pseudomonas sp. UBT]|uniref:AAA family ATPase n=1 Tax=Pseudomonas sp. UBT TaxID=3239198 RepID=UPI003D8013B1
MITVTEKLIGNIEFSIRANAAPFITYIIGNNGTGKSRLLSRICEIYENDESTRIKSILCVSNGISDRFRFTNGNKRRYLGARGVGNAIFRSSLDREIAKFLVHGIRPGKMAFLNKLSNALGFQFKLTFPRNKKSPVTAATLADMIDQRKIKNVPLNKLISTEGRIWLAKIAREGIAIEKITIEQARELTIFLDLNPEVRITVSNQDYSISFSELSSGEQNRIATALKIIAHAENNTLVLIDEPEISLHLKWQMEFHDFISGIMSAYENYHVLIATHSPVIVSQAAKDTTSDAIVVLESLDNKTMNSDAQLDQMDFRSRNSNEIKSFDGLTLDLFDIATYNTPTIDFRIADAILGASEHGKPIKPEVDNLLALLTKEGVTESKKATIREAITLIKQHFGNNKQ